MTKATSTSSASLSGLTPMERALLSRVEGLEQTLRHALQTQNDTIAVLEADIRARNEAITRLTLLLGSWLDPKALDPS